jgi:hypothetical protein
MSLFEKFTQTSYVPSIAGIMEDSSQLERRIEAITNSEKHSQRHRMGAVALILTLGLLALTDAYSAIAGVPIIEWERVIGGDGDCEARSVRQTSDGGYIIAGHTNARRREKADIYLVKTDPNGDIEWERMLGGDGTDIGYWAEETTDGGYIVVGFTDPNGSGDCDGYLIKTDSMGNPQWEQTWGEDGSDQYFMVQQTPDGGYIVVGGTHSFGAQGRDAHLVKFDSVGNMEWQRPFGESGSEYASWAEQTADGGYIIVGATESLGSGGWDVYLIKTDSQGKREWTQPFGGTDDDAGYAVRQTIYGGYIVTGFTYSYGKGDKDVYLIKTDSQGNKEWQNTFGGSGADSGLRVEQCIDGGFIVGGAINSPEMFYPTGDMYLVRTDSVGNLQWEKVIGGRRSGEGAAGIQQTSDGGYIVVGCTNPRGTRDWQILLIKLGAD